MSILIEYGQPSVDFDGDADERAYLDQRGLASSVEPDDGDSLPGFNDQVNVPQSWLSLSGVGESDIPR